METITNANVEYIKRERGGYYARVTLADGRWFRLTVTESASWQRTTEYFKWTAVSPSGKRRHGNGRSRIEAIRSALAAELNK